MTADTFGKTKCDSRLVRRSFLWPISTEAALSSDIKRWTLEGLSSLYCTPNSIDLGRVGGRVFWLVLAVVRLRYWERVFDYWAYGYL